MRKLGLLFLLLVFSGCLHSQSFYRADTNPVIRWGRQDLPQIVEHYISATGEPTINTGALSFTGHVRLANDKYIATKDSAGTNIQLLGMNTDNNIVFGPGAAPAGTNKGDVLLYTRGLYRLKFAGDAIEKDSVPTYSVGSIANPFNAMVAAGFLARSIVSTDPGFLQLYSPGNDNSVYLTTSKDFTLEDYTLRLPALKPTATGQTLTVQAIVTDEIKLAWGTGGGSYPLSHVGSGDVTHSLATDGQNLTLALTSHSATAADDRGALILRRTRGTNASPADVSNGDRLGAVSGSGWASGAFNAAATIELRARGVSGANVAGSIDFFTRNAAGTLANRWSIEKEGHFVPFVDATYNVGSTTNGLNLVYSKGFRAVGPFSGLGEPVYYAAANKVEIHRETTGEFFYFSSPQSNQFDLKDPAGTIVSRFTNVASVRQNLINASIIPNDGTSNLFTLGIDGYRWAKLWVKDIDCSGSCGGISYPLNHTAADAGDVAHLLATNSQNVTLGMTAHSSDAANDRAGITLRRTRNTSTSPTSVVANDRLGVIAAVGYANADYRNAALIQFYADSVSDVSSYVSGRMEFFTTNTTPSTASRWTLAAAGHFYPTTDNSWTLGDSTHRPSTTYVRNLDLNGSVMTALVPNGSGSLALGGPSNYWASIYGTGLVLAGGVSFNAGSSYDIGSSGVRAGTIYTANLNVSGTCTGCSGSVDWANVAASILPASTATYNLGSTSRRWSTLYTGSVEMNGSILPATSANISFGNSGNPVYSIDSKSVYVGTLWMYLSGSNAFVDFRSGTSIFAPNGNQGANITCTGGDKLINVVVSQGIITSGSCTP